MANIMKVASYDLTLTGSAQSAKDATQAFDFAKDVILLAASGNSADDLVVGSSAGQFFPLLKAGPPLRLGTILNRMGQSGRYDLGQLMVKGTASGKVHVMLIDPNVVGDND